MKNYYQILGIDKSADAAKIKQAFRRLASQHHPDKGGDTEKFQQIQEAYSVLGDNAKRAEYDNPNKFFGQHSNNGRPSGDHQFNFGDIFEMFGTRFSQPRSHARMSLWISLQDVATPGAKLVSVGTNVGTQTIEIQIPNGIADGDNVHYSGLAPGGQDLVVTFRIKPDPNWQRQENNHTNLVTNIITSIWKLITGSDIPIADIRGNQLMLTIPPMTQPGSLLRVKGRGLTDRNGQSGDMLVRLVAKIPTNISPELMTAIQQESTS